MKELYKQQVNYFIWILPLNAAHVAGRRSSYFN